MNNILKIGMIAPSKAGKTSLMTAIFQAMKDKLAGNTGNIQYAAADNATLMKIQRAIAEFKAITASDDIFAVPSLRGSEELMHYQFSINVGVEAGKQRISIDILDYPGGLLGMDGFSNVVGHLNESIAMIVPVPSEILIEWKRTSKINNPLAITKNIVAQCMLSDEDTRNAIVDWIRRRAQENKKSILIFVPIKCEAYFNDNGGTRDESKLLHEAVKELYVQKLQLTKEEKEFVQIETYAVDTYGIVELRDIELKRDNGNEYLVSTFRKRLHCKNDISIKGAMEVLGAIISFYLHSTAAELGIQVSELKKIINDRNFFEEIWIKIFGTDTKKRQLAESLRDNDIIYQAIERIADMKDISENRHAVHNTVRW